MKICKDQDTNKIPSGPYPLIFVCSNGNVICQDCANNSKQNCFDGDIYHEGPDLECDECGTMIPSAYGEVSDVENN